MDLAGSSAGQQPSSSSLPKSVFGYVWQVSARSQPWLVALTVAVFIIDLAPLELQRHIVNHALAHGSASLLFAFGAAYAAAVLLGGSLKMLLNVYRASVGERSVIELRRRAFRRGNAEAARNGTDVTIILSEAEPVGSFVGSSLSEPLLQAGTLVAVFGYMLALQPWIALLSLALFVPQVVFVPKMQRAINRRAGDRISVLRAIAGDLVTAASPGSDDTFECRAKRVYVLNLEIFKLKFLMNFLMNLLSHLAAVGVFLVGGWFVLEGRLELGTVVACVSGLAKVNDPWGDLVNYFRDAAAAQLKYRMIADQL